MSGRLAATRHYSFNQIEKEGDMQTNMRFRLGMAALAVTMIAGLMLGVGRAPARAEAGPWCAEEYTCYNLFCSLANCNGNGDCEAFVESVLSEQLDIASCYPADSS